MNKIKVYGKDIEDIGLIFLCILSSFFLIVYNGNNILFPFACKSPILYITAVSLIFLLYLKYIVEKKKSIKNIANIPILVYAGLIIISSIVSKHQDLVYWGFPQRLEGCFALLSYIIVYFAAFYLIKRKKLYSIIYVLLAFISIVSIIGILEFYGLSPLNQSFKIIRVGNNFKAAIYSTIGNQNFIGSLLSLCLMVSIILFVSWKNKFQKLFFFMTSVFIYSCLIVTRTRSAWLATISCVIIFLFFLIKKKFIKIVWKKLLVLAMVFLIITFFITITSEGRIASKFFALIKDVKRIELASENMDSLGSGRIYIWKNTIPLLKEYFLFGSGPDTFSRVFPYNEEEYLKIFGDSYVLVDKAHNEFLQIGVTTGIPSLLAYLLFIAVIIFKNGKIIFKLDFFNKYDSLILASIMGCIAYLIQSFFNISVVSVAPIYWMMLGINQNLVFKYLDSYNED